VKVRIVDDAPRSRTAIADVLTKQGWRPLEVDGAEEVLRMAPEEQLEIRRFGRYE
jgi:hypothetical protein